MHLLFHCQERHNCHCWHHYLPPSNFTQWTLSGVLGHIKNHFFPSINMHFSLTLFLNQLWVDVFFTKLQHSGGRSVRADAAPHNTPQNTSCASCQIRRAWFLTNVSIPPQLGSTRFCSSQLQAKKCSFGQFAFNEAANLVRNIKHIITQAGVRPQALGLVYSYFCKCAIISNRIL